MGVVLHADICISPGGSYADAVASSQTPTGGNRRSQTRPEAKGAKVDLRATTVQCAPTAERCWEQLIDHHPHPFHGFVTFFTERVCLVDPP